MHDLSQKNSGDTVTIEPSNTSGRCQLLKAGKLNRYSFWKNKQFIIFWQYPYYLQQFNALGKVGTSDRQMCIQCLQCLARHPQIRQREQRPQLHGVLVQPSVAHLHIPELALDHPKRVLDLGAHGNACFDGDSKVRLAAELLRHQCVIVLLGAIFRRCCVGGF